MPPITERIIEEMTKAIVDAVAPEQVIGFGSAARGEMGPDSDVDLLVIERGSFADQRRSRRDEIGRIRRSLSRFRLPKDILVFSTEEVAHWRHSMNHVIGRSLREGIVVYDRHAHG